MKWYKRDPDAALAGMIGLTPEERGIYNTVIDLLYSRDGNLPTDERFFARACGCDPRTWRRVRDILLAKGKFHIKPDGKLMATRVEDELKIARRLIEDMSKLGRSSAEKRKKINGHDPTAPLVTTTTTSTIREERKKEEETANAVSTPRIYAFESGIIRLTEKDFGQWKKAFSNLGLEAELLSLSPWAEQQGKKWFQAVSGALAKRNREIGVKMANGGGAKNFVWRSGIEGVS